MWNRNSYQDFFLKNWYLSWVFGIAFGIVLLRVAILQVVQGERFYTFANQNQLRKEQVPPLRGLIYDRDGVILADHRFRFDVVVIGQYLKKPDVVFAFLGNLLGRTPDDIRTQYAKRSKQTPKFQPIRIAQDVPDTVVAAIEEHKALYDGIDVVMVPTRHYPFGNHFSHVLGYVAEATPQEIARPDQKYVMGDILGRKGLEFVAERDLRGKSGVRYIQVDAHGRRTEDQGSEISAYLHWIPSQDPKQGLHVQTTLDADIQNRMFDAFGDKPGAGVVIEVNSGRVVAMMSLPSFDPNTVTTDWQALATHAGDPLINRVVQGAYPPGSTFKIWTALAGLHVGVATPERQVRCTGSFTLGRRPSHCWKKHGHGTVNLHRALIESCDVYFYDLAMRLSVDHLSQFASATGLGHLLGIELPYERSGLLPSSVWKEKKLGEKWQAGETLSVAIGQGYMAVTPLQLAVGLSSLLNGGVVYRPYIIEKILNTEHRVVRTVHPLVHSRVSLNAGYVEQVKKALIGVVNEPGGTAFYHRSKDKDVVFGGKTGTSQVRRFSKDELYSDCELWPMEQRHHGIFVGFWPVDHPKYVAVVVREHGCSGRTAIAIVRAAFETAVGKDRLSVAEGGL